MHFNVAVAMKKSQNNRKQMDKDVIAILCERIPDCFDYFDDDNMKRMTVSQFRKRKEIVQALDGYFDQFGCYSTNLSADSIQNGLMYLCSIFCHNYQSL